MSPLELCILISISQSVHSRPAHECVHDKVQHLVNLRTNHILYDDHPYDRRRLQGAADSNHTDTAPVRVRPYYDPDTFSIRNDIRHDDMSYIKSLMSSVSRFYHDHIEVIPVQHGLFLHRECADSYDTESGSKCVQFSREQQCGLVTIPDAHLGEDLLYSFAKSLDALKLPAGSGPVRQSSSFHI